MYEEISKIAKELKPQVADFAQRLIQFLHFQDKKKE